MAYLIAYLFMLLGLLLTGHKRSEDCGNKSYTEQNSEQAHKQYRQILVKPTYIPIFRLYRITLKVLP